MIGTIGSFFSFFTLLKKTKFSRTMDLLYEIKTDSTASSNTQSANTLQCVI